MPTNVTTVEESRLSDFYIHEDDLLEETQVASCVKSPTVAR